ncbi:MAG TPA: fatty-acid--CoA ligase, partial [Pseudonocardia sp.]|uniref:AMP-binding enzyme n=1 Tax=Pseudonocardia sp. TaxID=60912 RepID=UPI002EE5E63C
VIGVPHPTWGEQVHAVVTLMSDAELTAEELIAYSREQIAAYKCPRSVDFRETLPVSAAGKILKTELRAEYRQN